ncbi:MAG: ATP-dependent Clp protease ATP-binding subunit, partial [Planctomycetia bacterium]|nr:ATP-dependent Clp protease ATP-binding subunit [Planctomycetia bacterium]
AGGAIDAANVLKPALSRGEVQCIGATTMDEYRKYIEKDSALERRFQTIIVEPPTPEEAVHILRGLRSRYEAHHHVQITDGAIHAAVELSDRYISGRFLPDKAIDAMDEAGARVHLQAMTQPPDVSKIDQRIAALNTQKEESVAKAEYEHAAELRNKIDELKQKKEASLAEWRQKERESVGVVDEEVINEVVSRMTGIPLTRLESEEMHRLLHMEDEVHKRVISQDEAIEAIARCIRRSRSGLKDPRRPVGSFVFIGPTGVGKTLLAKALAEFLFGTEDALVQIDMSEYMEKHNASRLIGAPPGYVGYEEGGQLTERIRRRPYAVILFDEIEKAHADVYNTLLQIMEEGQLTDSFGRRVDFRNCVLIMTSNIGADILRDQGGMGFRKRSAEADYEKTKEMLLQEVERFFKPEFLNRVDDIIVFRNLTREDLNKIIDIELAKVRQRLKGQGLDLILDDEAKEFIIKKGYDPKFGARPLRRALENQVEDHLSEELLRGAYAGKDTINVGVRDGHLYFEASKSQQEPVEIHNGT